MKKNKGITLIALIITIIVLLILAGVSIAMLTGESGVITQAQKAKISTELSGYKEELELYKISKLTENQEFLDGSLTAGKTNLSYNTQKAGETGNIKTVITSISDEYMEKLEIIKGELLINTKSKDEIKIAQSLGIEVNPYDITEEGELLSSNGNLLLMDENGTLTIPDSVTKIGEGAFANLEGLKTIIIPGSVKEIGTNAFRRNTTLETVIMQEGIEKIGDWAFAECKELRKIEFPDSIITMETYSFAYCSKIKEIKIPPKVTEIKADTFNGNYSLEKMILNKKINKIGDRAFENTKISEITLPASLRELGENIFGSSKYLNIINIEEGAPFKYESGMLMSENKENIYFISKTYLESISILQIPEGTKNFKLNLKQYNNIKKLIIPSSLQSIVEFYYMPDSIEEIEVLQPNTKFAVSKENKILYTLDTKEIIVCYSKEENINIDPNNDLGLQKLNNNAFYLATKAKKIILPNSLVKIGQNLFGNNDLQEFNIGPNVSEIAGNFKKKENNVNVIIEPTNKYFVVDENILYNKSKTKLISVLYEIVGNFDISPTVEEIGQNAFNRQNKMSRINIPSSVKVINNCFNDCAFTEIDIPGSVEKIQSGTFGANPYLTYIRIDKEVDSIPGAPWGAPKGMKVVSWEK